ASCLLTIRQPSGTRFSTIVRTASSVSAGTRIRSNDGSSLVFPIVKRITSNEALCRMTVSKMPLRMPESMRCPDASTTSDATRAPCGHCTVAAVLDRHEREIVVLRGLSGERLHVGQEGVNQILRRLAAVPCDGFQQARIGV